jgi:hypothetical protein
MKTLDELSTQEYERMVDFMREDLESDMAYSKIIATCKKMFEEEGRDFDAEFEQWKREGKPIFIPKRERTTA